MANCPKCNAHLRIVDWKQYCPHCGTNIFVYDLQERLMQDADIAEVQYYHFQKKIDRLKSSYAGNKLAVARIFTSLLPAGALFLPIAKLTATNYFEPFSGNFNAIDLYNNFLSKLDLGAFGDLIAENRMTGICLLISVITLLLSAVFTVIHFVLLGLSCSPKGKQRGKFFAISILATTLISIISFLIMPASASFSGNPGIGAYLYLLLQIVNVGLDLHTLKKGMNIMHKQCYVGGIPIEEYFEMQENGWTLEQIRAEQYKRLSEIQQQKAAEIEAQKAENEKKEAAANG